jgi:acyl carrier protein
MTDLEQEVTAILRELIIDVPGPEVDVIETGLLDSLGLVTLVYELEQRCGITIPFETLEVDNFRTVRSIARLAETQQREAGG